MRRTIAEAVDTHHVELHHEAIQRLELLESRLTQLTARLDEIERWQSKSGVLALGLRLAKLENAWYRRAWQWLVRLF